MRQLLTLGGLIVLAIIVVLAWQRGFLGLMYGTGLTATGSNMHDPFTVKACSDAPGGSARYEGQVRVDGGRSADRFHGIAITIPNSARNPRHYDAGCEPRQFPLDRKRWLSEPAVGTSRVPILTLAFDGSKIHGYAEGAMPNWDPGDVPGKPDQILVRLRRLSSRTTEFVASSANEALRKASQPSLAARQRAEVQVNGRTQTFYAARNRDGYRLAAECNEDKLCRLFAPFPAASPDAALAGTAIEIWMSESLMPQADIIIGQLGGLLGSIGARI